MNSISVDTGVYRMMQGHLSGQTQENSDRLAREEARKPVAAAETNWVDASRAFETRTSAAPISSLVPIAETADPIRSGDITQMNAGSTDMARYVQSVIEGSVNGPVPMSALIAKQNYETALKAAA
ncbi:hypothetical protein [Tritonibacter horizontis]|uniref:Uncharacterized protein n=1 Tax=Tritonibacter horizontis TaxID=1768241 RepID=A0A132BXC8_9RHOB|nr:hypothetical protein [Tritonibacter horizontis]KUP92400.1 hypothetical protein TRIHO_27040 [Tritonibacter horizontis]